MLLDTVMQNTRLADIAKKLKSSVDNDANPNEQIAAGVLNPGMKYSILEEIGSIGTKIFAGIIDEEYLTEWKVTEKRCDIITRMMKSDATVRAIYYVVTLPLESANWDVDVDEDANPQDKKTAEIVKKMLFEEMTITWQDFIRQALLCLPYGFSVFEKVFEPDRENGIIKLRKLAPRIQKTIKKWLTDETGGLSGVEQRAYYIQGTKTLYKTVQIPVDKLVVFTYRQEGSNFEGDPMLRPAYKHWFMKDKLYLIQAVGLERHALGIPVIYLPRGASPADKEYAKQIVKTWRAHEEAGAVFPEGVKVDNITGTIQSQALELAIKHHDSEIAKSVLAQFLQLGTGSSGSWALSKDQSDFFLMSLNSIASFVCDRVNRFVIKPLVDMNASKWGKPEHYPKLKCTEISKTSNMETLSALSQLLSAGIVKVDKDMEDWARKTFSLPPKGEPSFEEVLQNVQQKKQLEQELQPEPEPEEMDPQQQQMDPAQAQPQPSQNMQAPAQQQPKGMPPKQAGNPTKKYFDMGNVQSRLIESTASNIEFEMPDERSELIKDTISELRRLKDSIYSKDSAQTTPNDIDAELEEEGRRAIEEAMPQIREAFKKHVGPVDDNTFNALFVPLAEDIKNQTKESIKASIAQAYYGGGGA